MSIQEKFSYSKMPQQEALDSAKSRVQELVNSDDHKLEEGLFLVHAPREQAYYVEDTVPMTRPGLGEEIVWSLD